MFGDCVYIINVQVESYIYKLIAMVMFGDHYKCVCGS